MRSYLVKKERAPGVFDLKERSISYLIVFGLIVGFSVGVVAMAVHSLATESYVDIAAPWPSPTP